MRKAEKYTAKDGTVSYRVRFRHGLSPRTGKPLQASETFTTKARAERFAKLLDVLGPQGALDQLYAAEERTDTPTLDEVAADHIKYLTGITEGTRLKYERMWSHIWRPLLGDIRADLVSKDAISSAVNALAQSYSYKSLKNQRGLLFGVLNRAVDRGYLATNPAKGVRLPRAKEHQKQDMRILTQAELDQILETIHPHYRTFVMFLAGTGCRYGEAVALQVRDVVLPNVRIRQALQWSPDNNRQIGPPKTGRSNRTVMLPPALAEAMKPLLARDPDALVFTAPRGGAILHRTFWSDIWLPVAGRLSPPRPRIHDLRHSHAAWLLAAGVPIHIVQARLGHESITTTVDTYGGLLPDAQIHAANAAALVFRPKIIESGTIDSCGDRPHNSGDTA